jgi:hypothetical protein
MYLTHDKKQELSPDGHVLGHNRSFSIRAVQFAEIGIGFAAFGGLGVGGAKQNPCVQQ